MLNHERDDEKKRVGAGDNLQRASQCPCCGSTDNMSFSRILWPKLVEEWELKKEEHEYIDRQQGCRCRSCGSSLRTRALAKAILHACKVKRSFHDFTGSIRGRLLRILEINEAGELHKFFSRRSRHRLVTYPEVDMMDMKAIPDNYYDLVVHSDTLEHIPDPVKALKECRRILKPGGFCCFTVPIVVARLTRSRKGLPPSYHGSPDTQSDDYLVHTEYGADAWCQVLQAGFAECRIVTESHPAAHALVGVNSL